MRFVFYIVQLNVGFVEGTNDAEVAEKYIVCDDYIVIHKDSGKYFCGSRDENEIHEVPVGIEPEGDEDGLEKEE